MGDGTSGRSAGGFEAGERPDGQEARPPLPLRSAGDGVLLGLAAGGDDHAFERLYARARLNLLPMLVKILGDHHEAEDAFQETMLTTLEKAQEYDPQKGSFVAWAAGIARRKAVAHLRKRAAEPFPPETVVNLAEALIQRAHEDQTTSGRFSLPTVVRALRPRHRQLLYLRFSLGYTATEVAELWGQRPGTVRELERYVLDRLRPRFLPPEEGPSDATEGR